VKTLLIDNFDSFTYNLYQLIAEVNRVPPVVVQNNNADWKSLRSQGFDNIVIGPGPGRPEKSKDFGVCEQVLKEADIPVLGVCLGHQGLCYVNGGTVDYAEKVMHGRISAVHHTKTDLFYGIPSPFNAVRYHSLVVSAVPELMDVTAFTSDNVVMAVRHRHRPLWGVQFHPESISSECGFQLIQNFRDLTVSYFKSFPQHLLQSSIKRSEPSVVSLTRPAKLPSVAKPQVFHRRLALSLHASCVFQQLFADSSISFWLDSALKTAETRFSFMGDGCGPLAELVQYSQKTRSLSVTPFAQSGECVTPSRAEALGTEKHTIFSYLQARLKEYRCSSPDLPFDFNLGFVGYFGYEMKGDCGYQSPHSGAEVDASWLFADRVIVFDHTEDVVYLVCLDYPEAHQRANRWLSDTEKRLTEMDGKFPKTLPPDISVENNDAFSRRHNSREYLALINLAKDAIKQGETYEVCLTNCFSKETDADPLTVYCHLRDVNPAPYAAYLKFPEATVVSSSPERFITIDRQGVVETKPIKGTRKRGRNSVEDEALKTDLLSSEKDRSENLMIVDLLRNDLGQVSDIGSVQVSKLFDVESYATVHQLVSTIRSRLKRDCDAIDCVMACFPGGSMTGAPKKRTMEIIDQLEGAARGIYSGSLGFFALNGCADLSIVIRTLVFESNLVSFGVGGAIVDLSEPELELAETLLKGQALIQSLQSRANH